MKVSSSHARLVGVVGLIATGALALSACGSDNTSTSASGSSSTSAASTAAASSSSAPASGGIACTSGSLTSSGSTAQANAMSAWIKAYQTACSGAQINYQGGGSGKGYTDFTAGTDDFAGSDYALSAAQKPAADKVCNGTAIDLPMAPGAIAIGYNLPGITTLKLSAKNLGSIFAGKITKWNDASIAADNPGVKLPSTAISTFHRSDTSGTSFNFSNYLANDAKTTWTYGANKQWPSAAGGQGSKGTAGIAQGVKSTPGGIGYMEDSYATQSSISVAQIGDAAGNFVALSNDSAANFIAKAKVVGTGGDLALSFDYTATGADLYPNVLVTYEFVCSTGNKHAPLLKSFLSYTAGSGQSILSSQGYVPLPSAIQTQVASAVTALS